MLTDIIVLGLDTNLAWLWQCNVSFDWVCWNCLPLLELVTAISGQMRKQPSCRARIWSVATASYHGCKKIKISANWMLYDRKNFLLLITQTDKKKIYTTFIHLWLATLYVCLSWVKIHCEYSQTIPVSEYFLQNYSPTDGLFCAVSNLQFMSMFS